MAVNLPHTDQSTEKRDKPYSEQSHSAVGSVLGDGTDPKREKMAKMMSRILPWKKVTKKMSLILPKETNRMDLEKMTKSMELTLTKEKVNKE